MKPTDWIITRRSIRKYTEKKIPAEQIELLLKAGMYAPSAVNKQPWHFVVIDDHNIFDEIIAVHPNAAMLKGASHAILVCGDLHLQHDDGYWVVDCGAVTENILLAAHSIGLGACWIGIHPRENRKAALRKLLDLPDYVEPYALVSLGFPAEEKETPDRFTPGKVHYNHWGNPYFK